MRPTVNSLSGGKTSSYIAMHYPADYNLFALVCVDDYNASGGLIKDKKIIQMVRDKLDKYCPQYKPFVATAEDPKTIYAMFDLEQKLGSEITWLRSDSFNQVMDKKKAIPNQFKRFCTHEMKIKPIFEWLYLRDLLPCSMRIGYRYDELERVDTFTDSFHYPYKSQYYPKSNTWKQRWADMVWRVGEFPLVKDKITHWDIKVYWSQQGDVQFPEDSNCQFCFWKDPQQLRKNFDTNPGIMLGMAMQEEMRGHTLNSKMSLLEISRLGLQLDFNFGTGSGCQAGFCTD